MKQLILVFSCIVFGEMGGTAGSFLSRSELFRMPLGMLPGMPEGAIERNRAKGAPGRNGEV